MPPDDHRFAPAAYPMIGEQDATGRVAGVYDAILQRMPMVPSLFKSLAVCPDYLELGWEQTRRVLEDDGFSAAVRRLATEAADAVPPPADADIREVVGDFVPPLARMLLVTAGLRLALDGTITGPPAAPARLESPEPPVPHRDVPATTELDTDLVDAIRADLATPIVNSVWRVAAAEGLLGRAWDHFGPISRTHGFAVHVQEVAEHTLDATTSLRWSAVASREALAGRDLEDAAAGAAAILDAYWATLPRVLTLAASSAGR